MLPYTLVRLGEDGRVEKYFAIISNKYDFTYVSTDWMNDPDLPEGKVLQPTIDVCFSKHVFDTEEEMLKFVSDWYRDNNNKHDESCPWKDRNSFYKSLSSIDLDGNNQKLTIDESGIYIFENTKEKCEKINFLYCPLCGCKL